MLTSARTTLPPHLLGRRHRDLFKDLETRQLTQAEEDIIQQRVGGRLGGLTHVGETTPRSRSHGRGGQAAPRSARAPQPVAHGTPTAVLFPPHDALGQVALQRKLLEAYEQREHARKVAELREVCPQLSDEAASRALQLCDGRYAAWGNMQCPGFVRSLAWA